MRGILSIHVGQAGVQIAEDLWDLIFNEHGMGLGKSIPENGLFGEEGEGKPFPMAILADLEPSAIDKVKSGAVGKLFHPDLFLKGMEDSADLFSRGKYSIGSKYIDLMMDMVQKLAQNCEDIQGFMIYNSLSGGTGSGFTSLILEKLSEYFPKKIRLGVNVFSSIRPSETVVAPYNYILGIANCMQNENLNIFVDNSSIYNIFSHYLKNNTPTFKDANRLISQVASSVTAGCRFDGESRVNLNDLLSNMVPYPQLQFLFPSMAPLIRKDLSASCPEHNTNVITEELFSSSSTMLACKPQHGKYFGVHTTYRGNFNPMEIYNSFKHIHSKRYIQFLDYIPTGIKSSLIYEPASQLSEWGIRHTNRFATMLSNTTAVAEFISSIDFSFDLLYCKRAFVHWFVGEGIEESEISMAREEISEVEKKYDYPLGEIAYE